MKRSFYLVNLAILIAGLVVFGSSDAVICIADTSVHDSEVTSSEANNASASATIVITMTGVLMSSLPILLQAILKLCTSSS